MKKVVKDRAEDAFKKGIKPPSTSQLPLVRIPTVSSDFKDAKTGVCQPDFNFSTPEKTSRLIDADYTRCDSEVSLKSSGGIHPYDVFDTPMMENDSKTNQIAE